MSTEDSLKFSLVAVHSMDSKRAVHEVILSTRSKDYFDRAVAAIRTIASDAPKLREATSPNSRAVILKTVFDRQRALSAVQAGKLSVIPMPGTVYPSLGDAARALGLSPASLRQTFSKARRLANGFDGPVQMFGLVLELVDGDTDRVSI